MPGTPWPSQSDWRRLSHSCTTTPRPKPHIKNLIADPGTVVTTASTYVNLDNLNQEIRPAHPQVRGHKIGRQENPRRADRRRGGWDSAAQHTTHVAREKPLPAFEYVVMSLDTAFSRGELDKKKQETDPSACSVWGGFRYRAWRTSCCLDCWAEKLRLSRPSATPSP